MTVSKVALIVLAMCVLAALDLAGSVLAKEYADKHRPAALVAGAVIFVVLFLVYARALAYAQLSIVTMGWVVLLQVGLLLLDWRRHDLVLDQRQLAAVVVILVLQCYLIVSSEPAPTAVSVPGAVPAAVPATASTETPAATGTPAAIG